jgi:secreted trypsin-like serine protease
MGLKNTLIGLVAGILCLGFVVAPGQADTNVQPRVIGGSDVSAADVPWQVLFIIESQAICGGSLISPTKIISAAHCFEDKTLSSIDAWVGTSKLSERTAKPNVVIKSITNHPNYDPLTYANDIAVVTLAKAVSSSIGVATIGLPANVDPNVWPALGTEVVVSGWGETDSNSITASDQLQAAPVQVLASPGSNLCGQYGSTYIADLQICAGEIAGGVDACQGDSGGPLTAYIDGQPVLAGIASTGFECAAAGFPGLYVRVTAFLPWLTEQGIDIKAQSQPLMAMPGSDRDGVLANLQIGQTYPRAVFAKYAKLLPTKSRLSVTGGKACQQIKQAVSIVATGKCRISMTQGKKRVPLVITIYSS